MPRKKNKKIKRKKGDTEKRKKAAFYILADKLLENLK